MNGMRKVVCFLMAMGLAVFALPSSAASTTKTFYAVFPSLISTTATTVDVTFNNNTPPPGISTINSIKIIPPLQLLQITGLASPPGTMSQPSTTDGSVIINNFNGIKAGGSLTFHLSVTLTSPAPACGTSFNWQAFANTGNAFNGDNFFATADMQLTTTESCGDLACGGTFGTQSFAPGTVFGIRGLFNKDGINTSGSGACTVDVAYANSLLNANPNQTNHFQWDTVSQPNAAFSYTINWQPVSLPGNPGQWPAGHPKVSWAKQPTAAMYDPGLACLGPVDTSSPPYGLPAPYGQVNSLISSTKIRIDTRGNVLGQSYALPVLPTNANTPLVANFPIVIGTERMQVTAVAFFSSGLYDLTVTRAQGGTSQGTPVSGNPVMFTSMPIYPNTQTAGIYDYPNYHGQQAHMCIADQLWVPAGLDTNGNLLILYSTTIVDLGDGWVGQ